MFKFSGADDVRLFQEAAYGDLPKLLDEFRSGKLSSPPSGQQKNAATRLQHKLPSWRQPTHILDQLSYRQLSGAARLFGTEFVSQMPAAMQGHYRSLADGTMTLADIYLALDPERIIGTLLTLCLERREMRPKNDFDRFESALFGLVYDINEHLRETSYNPRVSGDAYETYLPLILKTLDHFRAPVLGQAFAGNSGNRSRIKVYEAIVRELRTLGLPLYGDPDRAARVAEWRARWQQVQASQPASVQAGKTTAAAEGLTKPPEAKPLRIDGVSGPDIPMRTEFLPTAVQVQMEKGGSELAGSLRKLERAGLGTLAAIHYAFFDPAAWVSPDNADKAKGQVSWLFDEGTWLRADTGSRLGRADLTDVSPHSMAVESQKHWQIREEIRRRARDILDSPRGVLSRPRSRPFDSLSEGEFGEVIRFMRAQMGPRFYPAMPFEGPVTVKPSLAGIYEHIFNTAFKTDRGSRHMIGSDTDGWWRTVGVVHGADLRPLAGFYLAIDPARIASRLFLTLGDRDTVVTRQALTRLEDAFRAQGNDVIVRDLYEHFLPVLLTVFDATGRPVLSDWARPFNWDEREQYYRDMLEQVKALSLPLWGDPGRKERVIEWQRKLEEITAAAAISKSREKRVRASGLSSCSAVFSGQ